jgi:hypothetical protein
LLGIDATTSVVADATVPLPVKHIISRGRCSTNNISCCSNIVNLLYPCVLATTACVAGDYRASASFNELAMQSKRTVFWVGFWPHGIHSMFSTPTLHVSGCRWQRQEPNLASLGCKAHALLPMQSLFMERYRRRDEYQRTLRVPRDPLQALQRSPVQHSRTPSACLRR